MKKITILALGLAVCASAGAQTSVLKEAEQAMKGGKDAAAVMTIITPAFTNPETAQLAQTYYIPGKASFKDYDNLLGLKQFGKTKDGDDVKMGKLLIQGYDMYVKALPLDSLPDEKGKVKPKYSKEIKKIIGENYHKYQTAGLNLYNAQNYADAYNVWDLYTNLPSNGYADQKAYTVDPDTIVGELTYYQSLAAYFNKDMKNALACVNRALAKGYKNKNVYIVGMDAAGQLNDQATATALAKEGNKSYGAEDISFLATLINAELQKDNYPACYEAIDESFAIAANDSIKSQLYNIKGIINERENKIDEAMANLEQSLKLNPGNAKTYYDMGRLVQNGVAAKEDTADEATRTNVLIPEIKKAIEYYEKAYELNPEMSEIPNLIYRLYYGLDQNYHAGPEYAAKAEEWKNK